MIHCTLLGLTGLFGLVLLVQNVWFTDSLFHGWRRETILALDDLCPQAAAITSAEHEALLISLDEEFSSSEFQLKVYESLGGAIRIPTESYDGLDPSENRQLNVMAKFHDYLESRFHKVHANLKRTKVNKFSLVYEWKGIQNVKPLLLAAHMDVVPVNPDTFDDWIHPPYSGYYDGDRIWGRGSCDDKPGIIGTLTVVETLLERGFVPSRTVILAFGSDEEIGGRKGALMIVQYLLGVYGLNSLAMVVDEGSGFVDRNGVLFASSGVNERGYMNVRMDVSTPGGHSSMPPRHTGIGILADLITELEAHPHEPKLLRGRPYYQSLECRARYDTGFPEPLIKLLLESRTSDEKLRELGNRLADFDSLYYAMSGTTQAIDIIGGGVKVNALPELAWAVANYRIADYSSIAELMDRLTDIAAPIAAKHNMTLHAFGDIAGNQASSRGTIHLYDFLNRSFEPTPVTPSVGSGPYELFSGTIRSTIQTQLRRDNPVTSIIVSPSSSSANTDARHYLNLTRHIFRYNHRNAKDYQGTHTINEAFRAEAFLEQIRFFTRLILNADRSDLLE